MGKKKKKRKRVGEKGVGVRLTGPSPHTYSSSSFKSSLLYPIGHPSIHPLNIYINPISSLHFSAWMFPFSKRTTSFFSLSKSENKRNK